MNEIVTRFIGKENASDINLKNEPFALTGRMLPCYQDGRWSYSTVKNEEIGQDLFPDENYNFDTMEKDYVFVGAYDCSDCIGLAILKHQWNKYLYLHDLKVNRAYRGQHVAAKLINTAYAYAKEQGYRGIWAICQDNNLSACLFYIHTGFRIGGLDTEVYTGTSQEGKADIYFYKDTE
jgi:ribosomal protein S18 acetylase RimI-like enzyme